MPNKAKSRWELSNAYFREGFPKTISEEDIQEVFDSDIPKERVNDFIEKIAWLTATHKIKTKALDKRSAPTMAEYKATFNDLVNNLKGTETKLGLEDKLNALLGYPFDSEIDLYLIDLQPDKLPCDIIEETIENLKLIRQAASNAADDIKTKTGRRADIYSPISFISGLAGAYEKYTGLRPTTYPEDDVKSKFAKFVDLCCNKAKVVIPNLRGNITNALKEYEDSKK